MSDETPEQQPKQEADSDMDKIQKMLDERLKPLQEENKTLQDKLTEQQKQLMEQNEIIKKQSDDIDNYRSNLILTAPAYNYKQTEKETDMYSDELIKNFTAGLRVAWKDIANIKPQKSKNSVEENWVKSAHNSIINYFDG